MKAFPASNLRCKAAQIRAHLVLEQFCYIGLFYSSEDSLSCVHKLQVIQLLIQSVFLQKLLV
jgi:hypothetical protein